MSDAHTDKRDTLRVFYAPKERRFSEEEYLRRRIADLEGETAELSERLSEREQELLEALELLEERGLL